MASVMALMTAAEAPIVESSSWPRPQPTESYPDYRTADRTATSAEQARDKSSAMPSVRFEGSIQKPRASSSYVSP